MNAPAPVQTATQKLDELFKPFDRSDAPGLVVAVAHKGEVIYRRGLGLASIEHARANTPATRMRIGSTSKHFCALAVMLLVEDGKMDVQQPIRSYLPELSNLCGEPTLLQLMHHTGGLRDPMMAAFLINRGNYGHSPEGSCLQMMARFTDSNFEPGARMAYSNSGYNLLTLAVERVSGMKWEAFLTARVFSVLGMNDTTLLRSDLDIVPNMATLHMPNADGSWRRGIYPNDELIGAGGMISTVDDMLAWIAHLRAPPAMKKVGSAQTWARMVEQPIYRSGLRGVYCLGLTREDYRGVEIIHHAGATIGSQCQMLTAPRQQLDIIIMTNRMDAPAPALALKIVDLLLEPELQPARVPPAASEFPAVQGRWYSAQSRTLMSITPRKLKPEWPEFLMLAMHNAPLSPLYKAGAGLAMPEAPMSMMEIRELPSGEAPASMTVHICGEAEHFERLPATVPTTAELAPAICGRYRYTEFGSVLSIVLRDDRLCIDFMPDWGFARWDLEPISDNVLGGGILHTIPPNVVPNPVVMTLDRQGGKVLGFWLTSDRMRGVRFDRIS